MENKCFVGIDTSNYTTSAAICTFDGEIVANLKVPLPVREGDRGLRQSDAVFAHIKNMPALFESLGESLKGYTVSAIGVSSKPRRIEGSYMPCFLSGVSAASGMAATLHVPLYEFSHQEGHIMAAIYSSQAEVHDNFAAFHVSGGTTEVLYCKKLVAGFETDLVGGTKDLNAGQCIDRIGVAMGMKFPCGAEMDKLALENTEKIKGIRTSVNGLFCNLSGVENLSLKAYREKNDKKLVSAYTFEYIAKSLSAITDNLLAEYGDIPVIYAGGVMSSKYITNKLVRERSYFASAPFSADNAAGIALLCREKYLSNN